MRMRMVGWLCVWVALAPGLVLADPELDAQVKRVESALSRLQAEQQSVYQRHVDRATTRDIDRDWAKHLDTTRKILRIPSVSSTGEGIQETADTLERMLKEMGAKTAQFRANRKSHPLVYGHLDVGAKKTGVSYNMYDVQPIGDPEEWEYPAFDATIVKKNHMAMSSSTGEHTTQKHH